jgi:hypothetical protein
VSLITSHLLCQRAHVSRYLQPWGYITLPSPARSCRQNHPPTLTNSPRLQRYYFHATASSLDMAASLRVGNPDRSNSTSYYGPQRCVFSAPGMLSTLSLIRSTSSNTATPRPLILAVARAWLLYGPQYLADLHDYFARSNVPAKFAKSRYPPCPILQRSSPVLIRPRLSPMPTSLLVHTTRLSHVAFHLYTSSQFSSIAQRRPSAVCHDHKAPSLQFLGLAS